MAHDKDATCCCCVPTILFKIVHGENLTLTGTDAEVEVDCCGWFSPCRRLISVASISSSIFFAFAASLVSENTLVLYLGSKNVHIENVPLLSTPSNLLSKPVRSTVIILFVVAVKPCRTGCLKTACHDYSGTGCHIIFTTHSFRSFIKRF